MPICIKWNMFLVLAWVRTKKYSKILFLVFSKYFITMSLMDYSLLIRYFSEKLLIFWRCKYDVLFYFSFGRYCFVNLMTFWRFPPKNISPLSCFWKVTNLNFFMSLPFPQAHDIQWRKHKNRHASKFPY